MECTSSSSTSMFNIDHNLLIAKKKKMKSKLCKCNNSSSHNTKSELGDRIKIKIKHKLKGGSSNLIKKELNSEKQTRNTKEYYFTLVVDHSETLIGEKNRPFINVLWFLKQLWDSSPQWVVSGLHLSLCFSVSVRSCSSIQEGLSENFPDNDFNLILVNTPEPQASGCGMTWNGQEWTQYVICRSCYNIRRLLF